MSDIDAILSDAKAALRPLLQAAFDAGKETGRQQAAEEFKAKIAAVLNSAADIATPATRRLVRRADQPSVSAEAKERATPGTVKPLIYQLIRDAPNGLTTQDLRERTTFKSNSIRGTLYNLRVEGRILLVNDRWFAARDGGPLTDTESHSDSGERVLNGGSYEDACLTLVG